MAFYIPDRDSVLFRLCKLRNQILDPSLCYKKNDFEQLCYEQTTMDLLIKAVEDSSIGENPADAILMFYAKIKASDLDNPNTRYMFCVVEDTALWAYDQVCVH